MKRTVLALTLVIVMVLIAVPAFAAEHHHGGSTGMTGMMDLHSVADKFLKEAPANGFYLIEPALVKQALDAGKTDFVVLDVRPAEMYVAGHIDKSLNIPLPVLHDRKGELPTGKKVYVVCKIDTNSAFAVTVLRMHGIDAWIVKGGVPGWEMAGYPLVK